jgi:hypothetical protein
MLIATTSAMVRRTLLREILRWRPNRSQILWGIGMIADVVILAGAIGPVSRYATRQPQNATFVTALIALFGILVTQIVNTVIARSGLDHTRKQILLQFL